MNQAISGSRQDNIPPDIRQHGQTRRANKENTYQLIVEVAERLYRQFGFQKTTVGDIARESRMSSRKVYGFFAKKPDLNDAVCMGLFRQIEAEAERIAVSRDTAVQKIRNFFGAVESTHLKQYKCDRKLYDLIEASITNKWVSGRRHTERMTKILEQIIASGVESRELSQVDAAFATCLINAACIRFRDPRLIVELEHELEPTLDQMIGFCIAAITRHPV
jgi:AcrR family transcriptional regulator